MEMTDDPNEAYEVMPIEPGPHGLPSGWWTVKRKRPSGETLPRQEKRPAVRDRSGIQSEPSRRKGVGEGEGEIARGPRFVSLSPPNKRSLLAGGTSIGASVVDGN